MGHEVGFHYDVLSVCLENPSVTPKEVFEKGLNYLRNNGLTINGCAGHGGAFLHHKLIGYWIFKEVLDYYLSHSATNGLWSERKFRNIDLFTLSLKEYGLYEAYVMMFGSTRPFYYLSDCADKQYDNLLGQIEKAKNTNQTFCMCLMHPCRYRIETS
jgi:hypothetical protein